jgi:hypothetical protein
MAEATTVGKAHDPKAAARAALCTEIGQLRHGDDSPRFRVYLDDGEAFITEKSVLQLKAYGKFRRRPDSAGRRGIDARSFIFARLRIALSRLPAGHQGLAVAASYRSMAMGRDAQIAWLRAALAANFRQVSGCPSPSARRLCF